MNAAKSLPSVGATGGRSFVDAILAGQTVAPSFYEGWQTQRVIDAAIVSHERGQWVDVSPTRNNY